MPPGGGCAEPQGNSWGFLIWGSLMEELNRLYEQFKQMHESAYRRARTHGISSEDKLHYLVEAMTWCDAMLVINNRIKEMLRS